MGFKEAIRVCLKEKYATFQGRASRSEYWYFLLFLVLIAGIPLALGGIILAMSDFSDPPVFAWIFMGIGALLYLALLIPSISVYVRRFHDRNLSGWWILGLYIGSFIPYVGVLISIAGFVITVLKGTEGDNRFGPDPLRAQHQADVFA